MSYEDIDISVKQGAPIECFKFTGELRDYFYTSDIEPITIDGDEYEPLEGLTRSPVELTSILDSLMSCSIGIPFNCELAVDYAFRVLPVKLNLEIKTVHRDDPSDFDILWQGEAVSISVGENYVSINTQSIIQAQFSKQVNQTIYQTGCNHILYDPLCKVVKASRTYDATISGIDFTDITVSDASVDFAGGTIINTRTGEKRLIVSNSGTLLKIGYEFIDVEIDDPVQLIQGCDHTYDTCRDKFNNVKNYGGFMFMPVSNPFEEPI